jgi:hypothetical protein
MKMAKDLIEIENGVFSCKQKEDLCFVTLHQNAIEIITNNETKEEFLKALATINDSEKLLQQSMIQKKYWVWN